MKKHQKTSFARGLRRNQTDAERLLWSKLRSMQLEGVKFRRQQPIGKYIVDFVCFDKKIVIELDGGQHNEPNLKNKDEQRSEKLKSDGFRVLRFWDNDVLMNLDGVMATIAEALKGISPSPSPLPSRERNLVNRWDRQVEEDISCGKLNKLAKEALASFEAGKTEEP